MNIFRVIVSDTARARIIMALSGNIYRITEMLNLAPSTVSKHMSILKHDRLVNSKKEGKWIFFNKKNN
jgi:ArsR family transcriptional regulator, arsenate/arsenite/antimonite-responsive transcriptional repressor